MRTVSIRLPDTVDVDESEAKTIIAAHLYKNGRLSLGQAAETAGLSKRTFAEILGRYEVSIFNQQPEELGNDFQNA